MRSSSEDYNLTAAITAGTNFTYTWDLGDGSAELTTGYTTGSGATPAHTYTGAGAYTAVVTASNSANALTATTPVTIVASEALVTRTITYTYDRLYRLTEAGCSTGENFQYDYDAAGNREQMTATTPLSGTVVTTYTYDAAGRLTDRAVSDGRTYSYTWSSRNQMLAEWTQGYPVRTFTWDAAGRLAKATVFTLTTRFTYDGDGARLGLNVVGHGATTYTLDYAAGRRVLAEKTLTGTTWYLYPAASSGSGGSGCLGQYTTSDGWLYYLNDAAGYVRQGMDAQGRIQSAWLFDPDGTLLEGPEGPVSHLVCGGIYDWSTGLIFKDGRYFVLRCASGLLREPHAGYLAGVAAVGRGTILARA